MRIRVKTRKAAKINTERANNAARDVPSSGYIGMRRDPSVNTAAARTVTSTPPAIIQNCRLRLELFNERLSPNCLPTARQSHRNGMAKPLFAQLKHEIS